MADTKIQWANKVWNPVTGCDKVSEGCRNCYAERMANRLRGRCGYPADNPFRVTLHPEKLNEPLKWHKPSRIFVCSMGDLFHEDVPFEYIDRIFQIISFAPMHTFIILTKRPDRMEQYINSDRPNHRYIGYNKSGEPINWPLRNLWLGVSIENQEQANKRIPILLRIHAAVHLVSIEPMLGPINLTNVPLAHLPDDLLDSIIYRDEDKKLKLINKLDWVICGGETGPNARPLHPDWVRDLRDQCQSANVPFFFKQWGEFVRCDYQGKDFGASYIDSQCIDGELWDLDNCDDNGNLYSTGDNPTCPKCKGMGFLRIGKKAAGDLLDGERYHEIPRVS